MGLKFSTKNREHCEDKKPEKKFNQTLFDLGFGILMLLISLFLSYGAFFEKGIDDQEGALDSVLVYLLLFVSWSLTSSLLLGCLNRIWAERFSTIIYISAVLGLTAFLVMIHIKDIQTRGAATFLVFLIFIILTGVLLYILGKREIKKGKTDKKDIISSPWIIILWLPIMLCQSPLLGSLLLLPILGIFYLGERMGELYDKPLWGAFCGLFLLLALFGVLVHFAMKSKQKRK